jgi:OHCU decarboxylase
MTTPNPPRLLPIEELNHLPEADFPDAIRPLFEAAPPLAAALAARRPFASYEALLDAAAGTIVAMSEEQKVAVINAHPRIGESADGVRRKSALSYREQGYDAEAGLDPAEVERVYRELADLNAAYEAQHGFRFVVFVNRRPKSTIVEVLKERLPNPRAHEMAAALEAMLLIARDRLKTLAGG